MAIITIVTNRGTVIKKEFENTLLAECTYRHYQANMALMNIKQVVIQTPAYFYRATIETK